MLREIGCTVTPFQTKTVIQNFCELKALAAQLYSLLSPYSIGRRALKYSDNLIRLLPARAV